MEAQEFDDRNGAEWFVGTDPTTGQSIVYGKDGKTMAWCCDETMAQMVAQLPCMMASLCYTRAFLQTPTADSAKAMSQKNQVVVKSLTNVRVEFIETLQKRRA